MGQTGTEPPKRMVNITRTEIETIGFCQLVKGITRTWAQQTDSMLDLCWTNQPRRVSSCTNQVRAAGDHNMVLVNVNVKKMVESQQEFSMRNHNKINIKRFCEKLGEIDWGVMYESKSVDTAYFYFEEKVKEALESEAPLKKVQPRKGHKPWITGETRDQMTMRDNMREKARRTRNVDDWGSYKIARNKCTSMVIKDRKNYFKKKFNECEEDGNVKKLYQLTKNQLGWKTGGPPVTFQQDGRLVTAPKELAEVQAKFFEKKIEKLMEKMPKDDLEDPLHYLKLAIEKWGRKAEERPILKLREVTEMEILKFIKRLGNSSSHGMDGLDAITIKIGVTKLYKPICFLVNKSIRELTFPARWKTAKVIPLHKGKGASRTEPASYRPVSILNVISKIAERAVQTQLDEHMRTTKQYNQNQHAYRRGHSSATSLLQLADIIYEASDEKMIATAVAIDETAAFDCVNRNVLLDKLDMYNVGMEMRTWIHSYLSYRSEYVQIGNHSSSVKSNVRGIPQGSVLGPTLFAIYTNELPDVMRETDCMEEECLEKEEMDGRREELFRKNCKMCGQMTCYADDATFVITKKNRNTTQENIRRKLMKIKRHLNSNDLSINMSKTTLLEAMVVQKRCKMEGEPPEIEVLNEKNEIKVIKAGVESRLLGANFSQDITWKQQLEDGEKALFPAIRKTLGAIKHISRVIPMKGRKTLTEGLIMSRMQNLAPLWGGAPLKYRKKLQILINKSARVVLGVGRRTRTTVIIKKCGWLYAKEMIDYFSLVTMWKIVWQETPKYFTWKLSMDEDQMLMTKEARLKNTGSSFRWRTKVLWNKMEDELRECDSLTMFKKHVKKWIIERRVEDRPG